MGVFRGKIFLQVFFMNKFGPKKRGKQKLFAKDYVKVAKIPQGPTNLAGFFPKQKQFPKVARMSTLVHIYHFEDMNFLSS